MATLLEQLDGLRTLRPNWDGYNADPPDPRVLEWAKEFLTVLEAHAAGGSVQVYPGRAGGVQLEWEDGDGEHELEFNPDGSQGLLHVEKATGAMREERFAPGWALSPQNLFAR